MLTIQSHSHPYEVDSADGLVAAVAASASHGPGFLLVDATVARLYPEALTPFASERRLVLEATEHQKSFEHLTPVFTTLIEAGFRRDWMLVVVGGGVLQDIGCFVASVLFRGCSWELIPTTLLAQCDSCVGSKSSLNVGPYKNQLGTFYPPHRIRIPFDVLRTLTLDEMRSGVGEMIKLALIAGEAPFQRLRDQLRRLDCDPSVVQEMVMDALKFKKGFVEQDEFDRGPRNLLNYGHTFGHAYESATRYAIPHGIAVTLGVLTATYVSERLGLVPSGGAQALDAVLAPYYRPYHRALATPDFEAVLSAMRRDKKNAGGRLQCILTRGPGRMEKVPLDLEADLRPLLRDFLAWLAARP